jgi:hypothetical protein
VLGHDMSHVADVMRFLRDSWDAEYVADHLNGWAHRHLGYTWTRAGEIAALEWSDVDLLHRVAWPRARPTCAA